jgi:hypothetical protein
MEALEFETISNHLTYYWNNKISLLSIYIEHDKLPEWEQSSAAYLWVPLEKVTKIFSEVNETK